MTIKEKHKKNKGITLVALVITIIVLIILAGVSINAIMDDGLINNSKEAKEQWENGEKEEKQHISILESEIIGSQLNDIFKKEGKTYKCINGFITGMKMNGNIVETTVEDLKEVLGNNYSIRTADNTAEASGIVTTGMIVTDNKTKSEARIVIYGDVTGDGEIKSGDSDMVANYLNKTQEELNEVELFKLVAGDVTGDGYLGDIDVTIILAKVVNSTTVIDQKIDSKITVGVKRRKDVIYEHIDKMPETFKNMMDLEWKEDGNGKYYLVSIPNNIEAGTFLEYLNNSTAEIYDTSYNLVTGTNKITAGSTLYMKVHQSEYDDLELCFMFQIQ